MTDPIPPAVPDWMRALASDIADWFGEDPDGCEPRVSEIIARHAPAPDAEWQRKAASQIISRFNFSWLSNEARDDMARLIAAHAPAPDAFQPTPSVYAELAQARAELKELRENLRMASALVVVNGRKVTELNDTIHAQAAQLDAAQDMIRDLLQLEDGPRVSTVNWYAERKALVAKARAALETSGATP